MKAMNLNRIALAAGLALAQGAWAALPPPTPAQAQAAAAKKAEADAKAAKDKEALAKSMDAVSARWRARAAGQGWKLSAPVAIAAPAVAAPGVTPPATGAAPRSPQALQAANVPVKSEKLGTAPPSTDVKKGPSKPVPAGMAPATEKKSTPETANKK